MTFTDIPDWTFAEEPSVHTFFSAIALSNLEGKAIRLDASTQRKLLGFPVFGKKEIKVVDGVVRCYHMKSFGQDCDVTEHSPTNLIKYVNEQKKITC